MLKFKYNQSMTSALNCTALIFFFAALLNVYIVFITIRDGIYFQQVVHDQVDFVLLFYDSLYMLAPSFFLVLLANILVTAYPTVLVSDRGIKLHALWGAIQTPWLDWQAISKIRDYSFFRGMLFVGFEGSNLFFRSLGLLFWLGKGGFLITEGISSYDQLRRIMEEKRPELFARISD